MWAKMKQDKNLEYYFDSRIYTSEEIQKSIEQTKKDFPNKKVKVSIRLNDFGVYIITFKFENKNNYFNKIKISFWKKFQKNECLEKEKKSRLEQYYGENRYGKYKPTQTYRPY